MSTFHSLPGGAPLSEEQKVELEGLSKQICRKAFNQFGEKSQVFMLMGECAELIAAINRYSNQSRGTVEDVVEEMVDVTILIEQFMDILPQGLFDRIKITKLKRLQERLEGK